MRMVCELLPFVGDSRPYMAFCMVRLVQELAVNEKTGAVIQYRLSELMGCVIDYIQEGLDAEDVKNLLGAATDVLRLMLQRGRAALADFLCQFLAVAGADGTPLEVTRQLMAVTNQLLEPLQRAQRSAVRTQLDEQLPALLRLLTTCGDYDMQANLVECLFRLSTQPERPLLAAAWLPSDELRNAFVAISNFDPDCRLLLNAFNRRLGAERKVFSFPAESVTLAGFVLEKPDDPDYHDMWVDFNEGSGSVSLYCQRPVTETQPDETLWETVTIRRDDVTRARLRLQRHRQVVQLTLDRPCRQLLSSGALETFDGSDVSLAFLKGHDLHSVLGRLYGPAVYKFQACEELASERVQKASATIRGVHCRSTVDAPAQSVTTASSSAGCGRAAPRHKASVPLSAVSSGGGARPQARRPADAPKSSVPVLAGQRATGRYSPLEMRSPGRELYRERASPAAEPAPAPLTEAPPMPPAEAPAAPAAEAVPISQSSGTSVIEPTPRPAPASSAPSTPGVSSTAQACVRTPQGRRRPADSPAAPESASASGREAKSAGEPSQRRQQQGRSHDAEDSAEHQTQQRRGHGPDEHGDGAGEQAEQESDQEAGPNIQEVMSDNEREAEDEYELQVEEHDSEREEEMQEHDDVADKHQAEQAQKSKPDQSPEQAPSLDFEASPPASTIAERSPLAAPAPASPPPAAERAPKPADQSFASVESRQWATRRPRAAARAPYVEISDSDGGSDDRGISPSPPPPQRRSPARRDDNNNVPDSDDVSRRRDRPAARPRDKTSTDRGARAVKQTAKAAAEKKEKQAAVRGAEKQVRSKAPTGKRDKRRACVTFEEQDTADIARDEAKKSRRLTLAKDSSADEYVPHSIFSQSDSADSEFSAPWHKPSKKSRYPRSPHIFSDVGTSTDGERLPPSPPVPQRHVGTFKRFPVYDPRSVRNKSLLSQEESWQAELSRRGGRGRGGRGQRGAASRRGGGSKRGAASARGRGTQSGRRATSAKRGVSRSQPVGGWADRVSHEESRLQSPEVLRDEPAPFDERDLSDTEVPPAKRRPSRSLASRFGWGSTGSESGERPLEVSPPAPAAQSRGSRRHSGRQRTAEPAPPASPSDEPLQQPELELSGNHELCAELELSAPPPPAALDASGSGHVSHLSISATESAPALACPPNTPLSAGKAVAPAAPTAAQLGDAMQWQPVSPQRVRPPAPDPAALTATQEFRLDDHLALEAEASRPVSPAPLDASQHLSDSPLPSPIRAPSTVPPTPSAAARPATGAAPPPARQPAVEFRQPLPPPPPPPATDQRPQPSVLMSQTTDMIRAELSGMLVDWETSSVRSEQQQQAGPAELLRAVAAIRRQVRRLEERDEQLYQLSRRSAAAQETLLAQQRAAVATQERLGEAATAARRQAAEKILAECERLERQPPAAATARAPPAADGVESEIQSVQRELEQMLSAAGDDQLHDYRC
ncbi:Synaptonemal complex protein 2 [Amphibalanus amphitrite]|uniref:Synaptonemal complex protein 2 n=1 Tax=Amphibalanus amphitrite TaxID=1232801 RepID=A0A6A4X7C5_AMPAM|nr:Synaptonemal complex protein 2 [Amphibalanus amphitrite]